MISIDLTGKSILITGALGAIAEHMVRRLTRGGATLVLTDIKPEREAKALLDEWKIPPATYTYIASDITDSKQVECGSENSVRNVCQRWTRSLGHAGGCGLHPFATTSEVSTSAFFASTSLRRRIWRGRCWRPGGSAKLPGHLIFTSSYVARMPHT